MKFILPEICHDRAGFEALARLHVQIENCSFEDIEIDMSETKWIDADMCAAFGAIIHSVWKNINSVALSHIRPNVRRILSKNGFLSHYGRVKLPDRWGTTISYQRFSDVRDDIYFYGYIENELISRNELPEMSPGLLKQFRKSIFEIFGNAVLHSQTKMGIFSCGQFFPKRNRLDFTVADLGVGIPQKVREFRGVDLTSEEAICWATGAYNTTRGESGPGGLGLNLLGEFICLNGGRLQIVSDSGYWRQERRGISTARLRYPFPGTVVSVEVNTADTHSYSLTSELNASDQY